ncbi:MAG: hypothetical protein M1820_005527 [Bogoriella megaspora]|nr:MAG: hypothetical protein M1820_005527 [Bogoriella megaspora]
MPYRNFTPHSVASAGLERKKRNASSSSGSSAVSKIRRRVTSVFSRNKSPLPDEQATTTIEERSDIVSLDIPSSCSSVSSEPRVNSATYAITLPSGIQDDVSVVSNRGPSGHLREIVFSEEGKQAQLDGSSGQTSLNQGVRESSAVDQKHESGPVLAESSQTLAEKTPSSSPYPTVVHRPRKRPSLPPLKIQAGFSNTIGGHVGLQATPDTTNSSNPSNYQNSTSPVSQPSTAKTSLFSETTPQSAESRRSFRKLNFDDEASTEPKEDDVLTTIAEVRTPGTRTPPLQFPTQDSPCIAEPSLATAEKAAATKAFFELHYNHIFNNSRETCRTQRRLALERYLSCRSMSLDDRQRARHLWALAETDNLRQKRVLESRTMIRSKSKGISAAGYESVRILGKGSFGVVQLVREISSEACPPASGEGNTASEEPSTESRDELHGTSGEIPVNVKEVFAMKVIRKSDMLRNCQEGHLKAERDFLVAAKDSRWVVPLIASFQDRTNLYLVMEYMVGGDFLGLLLREDVLDEYVAKWYLAEMVLCIEETHRMRWIHRDVKPDNFLISTNGHLKISDFGLAFDGHWAHSQAYYKTHRYDLIEKLGINIEGDSQDQSEEHSSPSSSPSRIPKLLRNSSQKQRSTQPPPPRETIHQTILDQRNRHECRKFANSVVGTSQYMAPEVIRGENYDARCDWWSIGIILYECLYGCTPFFCENRNDTKLRILKHSTELKFPSGERWARPATPYKTLLDPPTWEAQDLIWKLLQGRHVRLGARKYVINDLRMQIPPLSRLSNRSPTRRNGTGHSNGGQAIGCHVFPNDAEDIKAHPFFTGIPWSNLHLQRPPFVPEVRPDQPITKYFEEEKDIIPSAEFETSSSESDEDEERQLLKPARRRVPKAEKKRPRDKILRDPEHAKVALQVRKRSAFLGYTYRRPRIPVRGDEE